MYLAKLVYQPHQIRETGKVLTATADCMASYLGLNIKTEKYHLGPLLYDVTENTPPNSTRKLAFEIAY
jgi:hypothetical protein